LPIIWAAVLARVLPLRFSASSITSIKGGVFPSRRLFHNAWSVLV
jgi:hypothetical protein